MSRSFQFALHECLVDDDLGVDIGQFTPLPCFHLLAHGLEVPLHAVHADRDAVDERERLRVLREHRGEHTSGNVSEFWMPQELSTSSKPTSWESGVTLQLGGAFYEVKCIVSEHEGS